MDEQATQRQTGLALDICSAESAGEGEEMRVGVCGCMLPLGMRHVATWRMPERVWQARVGAEVKCRGRRRRRHWEEGEGRERRIHPKTYGWERQTHMVRKGFPVPPLLLPPVLQVEEEITKREDVDGENDEAKL
jgi:hypothetical protein